MIAEVPPGFLEAILKDPGDPTARLVLADWLEERDDDRSAALRDEKRLWRRFRRMIRGKMTTQVQALGYSHPWWVTNGGPQDTFFAQSAIFTWKKPFPRCDSSHYSHRKGYLTTIKTPADIFYNGTWRCFPCWRQIRASERFKNAVLELETAIGKADSR